MTIRITQSDAEALLADDGPLLCDFGVWLLCRFDLAQVMEWVKASPHIEYDPSQPHFAVTVFGGNFCEGFCRPKTDPIKVAAREANHG